MKLVHPDFVVPLELPESRIFILILENPLTLREFVQELREQTEGKEGRWVLSEENNPLKLSTACELILDPFSLDINQRKMVTSLYNRLDKSISSSDLLLEWNQTESYLLSFTEKLLESFDDFAISYRNDIAIKDFLKFMDVHFEVDTMDFLEHMIDYMRISVEVTGTRLLVLCNAKTFLSDQEIQFLYEQALYHKFRLLLVEGHAPEKMDAREKWLIVDKDNCVIKPADI